MAGEWVQADSRTPRDLKVGDKVLWKGQRVAAYKGRILAVTEEDYAVGEESGKVIWMFAYQFKVWR